MKQVCLGFATLLLGSSLIYGYDTDFLQVPVFDLPDQNVVSPDSAHGLTPKRLQTATSVQHIPVPLPVTTSPNQVIEQSFYRVEPPPVPEVPVVTVIRPAAPMFQQEPANGGNGSGNSGVDPYLYAELERMNSVIQQLQKDTAKPDPSKSWSAPRVTGRLLFNHYSIDQPDGATSDYKNKAGLRELRLGVIGTGYDAFDYKAEIALANNGHVNLVDAWIGAKNVPGFGYVRVGHFLVEDGISFLSGSSNTTSTDTLAPNPTFRMSRRFGIGSTNLFANDRIRLFYGVFQGDATHEIRFLDYDDQGPVFNTRLTMLPYYGRDGRNFLHVGGHYTYVSASPAALSAQVGGKNWLASSLTTGRIESNHNHRAGLELLYQRGAFAVLSETYLARYGMGAAPTKMATGTSVELGYFLTGEHRAYSKANATFGAPTTVNRPFQPYKHGEWNLVKGLGAWQIFTQYSYLDLDDWRDTGGGRQHDLGFGVNWYWTPNLRWTFEYVHSQQNKGNDYKHSHQDIFGASARVSW